MSNIDKLALRLASDPHFRERFTKASKDDAIQLCKDHGIGEITVKDINNRARTSLSEINDEELNQIAEGELLAHMSTCILGAAFFE